MPYCPKQEGLRIEADCARDLARGGRCTLLAFESKRPIAVYRAKGVRREEKTNLYDWEMLYRRIRW